VFRGSSNLTLDNKGRLVVPARHRDVLLERCDGHLVFTADPDQCVLLYPLPEWETIEQKLDALANIDKRVRGLQRRLTGHAVETEMDAAGRVLVPPELREYAQLDKDVVLVGQGKKFELWNRDNWKALAQAPGGLTPEDIPPQLEDFSL
jgi:MraZ protein